MYEASPVILVPQRGLGLGRRELKLYSSMYDKKADTHDCRGSNGLQLVASSLLVTPRRRHPLLYFCSSKGRGSSQRFGIDFPVVVSGGFAGAFQKTRVVGYANAFLISFLERGPNRLSMQDSIWYYLFLRKIAIKGLSDSCIHPRPPDT